MTFDLPGKSLTRSFGFRRVAAIIVSLAVLLPLAVYPAVGDFEKFFRLF